MVGLVVPLGGMVMGVDGVIVALTFKDGVPAFAEQHEWAPWTKEDRLFILRWVEAVQQAVERGRPLRIKQYGPDGSVSDLSGGMSP